jgi:hypothetical protein
MKKSLKIIYSLLGIFCAINCSECNNFVTRDKYGGTGDTDRRIYTEMHPKNSQDFENFIKYFGRPCVFRQFFPEEQEEDIFKPFENTVLNEMDKYEFYLLSTEDTKLSPDERQAKEVLLEKREVIKKFTDLKNKINRPEEEKDKEALQKELEDLIRKNQFLLEAQPKFFKFVESIKSPIVLNDIKIKNFTSSTHVSFANDKFSVNTIWTIEVEKTGRDPYIKLHEYYLDNLDPAYEVDRKNHYLTIRFDVGTQQNLNFSHGVRYDTSTTISTRVEFGIIPRECVMCTGDCKIDVELRTPGFHLTNRWPYLKKQNGKTVYEYVRTEQNAANIDLRCVCGISKDEFLNTAVTLNFNAAEAIKHLEGAMHIYNGPYIDKPCSIDPYYDTTNLPDRKFWGTKPLHDTFDHEFFIKGIKSKKITISFPDLQLIPDIEDRFYSGLNGHEDIIFGKDSNRILGIYASRILTEMFHLDENACACTKAAALSQFVHYWMTYQEHERVHAMNPVEIFCLRKGICVDYTHLFLGLCSSIGINNIAKISGVVCFKGFQEAEKHAWALCYCPECKHIFEYDQVWDNCYQTGPEHIFLSKTHRVNDTIAAKIDGGEVEKDIHIKYLSVNGKPRNVRMKE